MKNKNPENSVDYEKLTTLEYKEKINSIKAQ